MLRVFNWLWDKAQRYGEERIIATVHSRAEYHRMMAETAHLKEKLGYDKDDDPLRRYERPRLTPQQHGAIHDALSSIITDYWREQEHEEARRGR